MIPEITIDFETKSYSDLRKVGAWAYSEDPTTDIICVCWGVNNDPIKHWVPGDPLPLDLFNLIAIGAIVEAHNVAFERSIWINVLARKYGWPIPKDEQWRDTMAVAAYYAMPLALDRLAFACGFQGKDAEGSKLIQKYSCLYNKNAKTEIPPEDMVRWIAYCKRDVQIEQSISDYLGPLPDRELPVFLLDQKINMRGIYLDQAGIDAATEVADGAAELLKAEFKNLVGFNVTQNDKVRLWLEDQGVVLEDMTADTLKTALKGDEKPMPQGPGRRAIEIRLLVNKASTKKLDAMSRQRGKDGRSRFQTRYHGAGTGRWTGTGWQPLNLNRGFEAYKCSDGTYWPNPDALARDIMYRDAKWLELVYGDPINTIAKASRHWIQAQKGYRILAGDFVSIEAVVLACLAHENWKVDAFAQGKGIYELMACKIYDYPLEWADDKDAFKAKYKAERQDGKTGELAFGYQGALNAWLNFDSSGRHTDERIVEICKAWRAEHPMTVLFWRELEKCAILAIRNPGEVFWANEIGFEIVDDWLSMILPNGKRIWYYKPELRVGMPSWHKPEEDEKCAEGSCTCRPVPKITYMAQKTGQWKRVYTYGGKLAENATQATSREILVPAMLRAEASGYPIILSVYDEIVAEVPLGQGSKAEFEEIMKQSAGPWMDGWPIGVDAWEGDRYKK